MALTTIGLMALLGCFTGFMAGLLGIGGGMIITPFLIMLIPSSLIPHEHIVHVAIHNIAGNHRFYFSFFRQSTP